MDDWTQFFPTLRVQNLYLMWQYVEFIPRNISYEFPLLKLFPDVTSPFSVSVFCWFVLHFRATVHNVAFVSYLGVRLARSWGAQRWNFGGAGGSTGGGDRPPSFGEPGEGDEGSGGTGRTLRRLSEDRGQRQDRKRIKTHVHPLKWCVWWSHLLPTESLLDLSFLTLMYERLKVTLRRHRDNSQRCRNIGADWTLDEGFTDMQHKWPHQSPLLNIV